MRVELEVLESPTSQRESQLAGLDLDMIAGNQERLGEIRSSGEDTLIIDFLRAERIPAALLIAVRRYGE